MGASMPAAIKARPIAARLTQRRQNAILVVAAIIFIGMLMLRGGLLLNLKAMFPTAPDANTVPLQSPIERTPIMLAQPAATATPPSLTITKKKKQPPAELPRIALLFLTRGPMPLENIWRDFLIVDEDYVPSKKGNATWQKYYTMYVHTSPGFKYPSNSLFAPFTVDHPIPAKWGDHSIIDAERKLVVTALKESSNSFFVLLSETHVPLYSSAATYLQLATAEHSRVHACGNDSEEDEYRRMTYRMAYEMKLVNSGIEEKTWRKSSQWFGLIRSHANLVAEETIVDAAFKQYCYILPDKKDPGEYIRFCVSDEHYIPTMLAINKLEEECDCDGHVTRVVWTGNFMHPKSFGREEATMDTLRHELRGEHECRQGRVLERVADQVLRKVDLVMEGADDVFVDGEDEEEAAAKLTGLELINYAIESEKAVVMLPSCPLFARKIVQEAEPEWRDLLKTVLQPI